MFPNSSVYDKIKFMSMVGLPALSTLYFTLGAIWGLPAVEQVIGTLAALATFLGALTRRSATNYDKSDEKYDGDMIFGTDAAGNKTMQHVFNDPPADLEEKKEVLLKVQPDKS